MDDYNRTVLDENKFGSDYSKIEWWEPSNHGTLLHIFVTSKLLPSNSGRKYLNNIKPSKIDECRSTIYSVFRTGTCLHNLHSQILTTLHVLITVPE